MRLPSLISKTETCFGKEALPAPVPHPISEERANTSKNWTA